jgi:hypothetical protein
VMIWTYDDTIGRDVFSDAFRNAFQKNEGS